MITASSLTESKNHSFNARIATSFRRQGGRTNIDAALQKAVHLFKNHKGFAKDKEIYLISDGKWNEGKNPKGNLIKLKNLGVKIRVFAIGKKPSRRNLEKLASTPCKDCHMRLSANFEKQMKLIKKLTKRQGKGRIELLK